MSRSASLQIIADPASSVARIGSPMRAPCFLRAGPGFARPARSESRRASGGTPRGFSRPDHQQTAGRSTNAAPGRPPDDPGARQRPDRDRPGRRVRLLGHPGLPRAEGRGLPRRAGQLEPGHDHDRPLGGRPHLRGAARPRGGRGRHRARAARRAAAHARRADRAQPGDGADGRGRPRPLRGRADRRRRRGDPPRRGPRGLPPDDGRRRPGGARQPGRRRHGRGPRRRRGARPAGDPAARVHAGR